MPRIGLIIAGALVTACGGPGTEGPSNALREAEEAGVAANDSMLNSVEIKPAPEVTNSATNLQGHSANPCLTQGADRLQVASLRAAGTEPFWGARVEGRCVTYSNPDNQQGVRVWTHYSESSKGRGAWVGQLDGNRFEMRVWPEANCSDGMSDKRYPMAVELWVNGENRKGCAEPL
jgi:uncharacterized membrane protein